MFTYNQKTDPPAFQGCGANVFNSCNDISIIPFSAPLNIRNYHAQVLIGTTLMGD